MIISLDHWAKIYKRILEKDSSFQQALKIARINTQNGKIWLIGGYVYKNIIAQIYVLDKNKILKDYDFIIENPNEEIQLPLGWYKGTNTFKNLKFKKLFSSKSIDFIPLSNIRGIQKNGLEPSIENYLTTVPLNIHSIAYSTNEEILIGEACKKSLERKIVAVNNMPMLEEAASLYQKTPNQFIKMVADKIGFSAELL